MTTAMHFSDSLALNTGGLSIAVISPDDQRRADAISIFGECQAGDSPPVSLSPILPVLRMLRGWWGMTSMWF